MGSIDNYLRESLFPELFGGEEVKSDIRKILGHSVKHGVLGIPYPQLLAERAYNTSKAASKVLVGSLLGCTNLNYVAHKFCIRRASADGQKKLEIAEKTLLSRQKDLSDGVVLNHIRRAMANGAWITAIPHCLNVTELSCEDFQDNLLLRYIIVLLNVPTEFDGCSKKFLFPYALSCAKGRLVLAWHNDANKEWGALSAQATNPSDISYELKINSRKFQGERNGAGARVRRENRRGG